MNNDGLQTPIRETTTSSYFSPIPKNSPPWYPLLRSHLDSLPMPIFQLSTLSPPSPPHDPHDVLIPRTYPSPRARTMVYRGMFAELPHNKHNSLWGELNSYARHVGFEEANRWTSEILTFTTDSRSMKVEDVFYAPDGYDGEIINKRKEREGTSGGGAPVETVFWIGDQRQVQWRIRGRCYLLCVKDIDKDEDQEISKLKREIGKYVWKTAAAYELDKRKGRNDDGDRFLWSEEILAHFANLAPRLRGSFANPTPRLPIAVNPEDLVLGTTIDNEEVPRSSAEVLGVNTSGRNIQKRKVGVALGNFRVGVVIVEEVDRLDLSAKGGFGERWIYKRVSGDPDETAQGKQFGNVVRGWRVCEVWP